MFKTKGFDLADSLAAGAQEKALMRRVDGVLVPSDSAPEILVEAAAAMVYGNCADILAAALKQACYDAVLFETAFLRVVVSETGTRITVLGDEHTKAALAAIALADAGKPESEDLQ